MKQPGGFGNQLPIVNNFVWYQAMIIGFISKGAGILVPVVVVLPILASIILEGFFFPESRASPQMWVPGTSLLFSAAVLFLLNRHLKQGSRRAIPPPLNHDTAFSPKSGREERKQSSKTTYSGNQNTGWFMFIPTGIWPFIIGALGLFLVVGSIIESTVSDRDRDSTVPNSHTDSSATRAR